MSGGSRFRPEAGSPRGSKLRLGNSLRHRRGRRLLPLFRSLFEARPKVGVALPHLIAELAPAEGGQRRIAELLPGLAQPLLQGSDIGLEKVSLIHDAGMWGNVCHD